MGNTIDFANQQSHVSRHIAAETGMVFSQDPQATKPHVGTNWQDRHFALDSFAASKVSGRFPTPYPFSFRYGKYEIYHDDGRRAFSFQLWKDGRNRLAGPPPPWKVDANIRFYPGERGNLYAAVLSDASDTYVSMASFTGMPPLLQQGKPDECDVKNVPSARFLATCTRNAVLALLAIADQRGRLDRAFTERETMSPNTILNIRTDLEASTPAVIRCVARALCQALASVLFIAKRMKMQHWHIAVVTPDIDHAALSAAIGKTRIADVDLFCYNGK